MSVVRPLQGFEMPMETSHVWLGFVSDKARAKRFFKEQYDDDDQPISEFAGSQGEKFFDHDWLEFNNDDSGDIAKLVSPCSYSESYLSILTSRAFDRGITNPNLFILADSGEFDHPVDVQIPGISLWYLGIVTCDISEA